MKCTHFGNKGALPDHWREQVHDDVNSKASSVMARLRSTDSPLAPQHVPFADVTLGPLLGRGGYGRVYRGTREDETIAVKVPLL